MQRSEAQRARARGREMPAISEKRHHPQRNLLVFKSLGWLTEALVIVINGFTPHTCPRWGCVAKLWTHLVLIWQLIVPCSSSNFQNLPSGSGLSLPVAGKPIGNQNAQHRHGTPREPTTLLFFKPLNPSKKEQHKWKQQTPYFKSTPQLGANDTTRWINRR